MTVGKGIAVLGCALATAAMVYVAANLGSFWAGFSSVFMGLTTLIAVDR